MARTSKSHSNAIKRCAKSRSADTSATRNKKSKKSTTKKVVKTSVKASATRSATKKGTKKVSAATKSTTKKKTTKAGKKTAVVVPLSLDDVKMKKSQSESEKPKGVAETIAKRLSKKQAEEKGAVKRPRMRRGRRPKNLADYTPTHGDEESESADNDFQGLQYDTGISVGKRSDDFYSFERFEDSEEELNFDS